MTQVTVATFEHKRFKPNLKVNPKVVIAILVLAGIVIFRNPLIGLIVKVLSDAFTVCWNVSAWIDKLIWGVKVK